MERWLPPRAFVLGVARSVSARLFLHPLYALSDLLFCVVRALSLSFCRRKAVFPVFCCRALASCWCLCRGGVTCVGGYVCCGVCVFSLVSPCYKESPRGASLCTACLPLLLLSRPLASKQHMKLQQPRNYNFRCPNSTHRGPKVATTVRLPPGHH